MDLNSEGYFCALCNHRTSSKYIFNHWNKTDIALLEVKCVKTNTKGDFFTIFPLIGKCLVSNCGQYYGATTRHHPLKRVGREHYKKLHGSEDMFEETIHMRNILLQVAGPDVRMSVDSVSQGESELEEGGLLTCSIPGCGESEISSYGGHFSRKHKELPLDQIRVTTEGGKLLTCHDLFNFALKCALCSFVSVTGHTTIKNARKSMKKHWLRDHKNKNIEDMAFSDILPEEPGQGKEVAILSSSSPAKKQKTLDNSPLLQCTKYRCVECGRLLELGGGFSPLQHWTKQHPHLPPAAFRLSRVSDEVIVSVRDLYQYVYQCQAPACQHISVSNQSEGDAVSKVKEHWMRQHKQSMRGQIQSSHPPGLSLQYAWV